MAIILRYTRKEEKKSTLFLLCFIFGSRILVKEDDRQRVRCQFLTSARRGQCHLQASAGAIVGHRRIRLRLSGARADAGHTTAQG